MWYALDDGAVVAAGAVALGAAVWGVVRVGRRLVRAARLRGVIAIDTPLSHAALRDALRRQLDDPALDVLYRVSNQSRLIDWRGAEVDTAVKLAGGRILVPVDSSRADSPAMLWTLPIAARRVGELRAMLGAVEPAIENCRLQAVLRGQLADVAASRSRVVRAALSERRSLEGKLHDGTQASLYEARSQLRLARRNVSTGAASPLDSAVTTLAEAIAELGALVRGIYPAGMRETGLANALYVATADLPLTVTLQDEDPDVVVDEMIATAGFFTVMDALRIAVSTDAQSAHIRLTHGNGEVQLAVSCAYREVRSVAPFEGGIGDLTRDLASSWDTDGKAAMEDRVQALDGAILYTHTQNQITVNIVLPCGL